MLRLENLERQCGVDQRQYCTIAMELTIMVDMRCVEPQLVTGRTAEHLDTAQCVLQHARDRLFTYRQTVDQQKAESVIHIRMRRLCFELLQQRLRKPAAACQFKLLQLLQTACDCGTAGSGKTGANQTVPAISLRTDFACCRATDHRYAGKSRAHFGSNHIKVIVAGTKKDDERHVGLCNRRMEFLYRLVGIGSKRL